MSDESVSTWIDKLKAGDEQAAQVIWERYFRRVMEVARRRLGALQKRVADEEDVAASVFESLCLGAAAGRFTQLQDRDDLWKLILTLTRQKAVDQIRRETRQKRGAGAVRGDSVFRSPGADGEAEGAGIAEHVDGPPTPEFLAMVAEYSEMLFSQLTEPRTREVAELRLEGYSNTEIAERLEISLRSVERKLQLIRKTWEAASDDQDSR